MLASLLIAVQVGLAFLPNIELVSLLIIVYTMVLRKKTIYIISVFILIEGILYGFGLWWINYLYIWLILYFITIILAKTKLAFFWAIISGAYGLAFGALCAIPYLFIGSVDGSILGGLQMAFSYWVSGIPFDITHGVANFIIALVLYKPLYMLLSHIVKMYYSNWEEL
jgi:energy-coupling factor transport system substrate-specific component